ncbi:MULTISPECIES: TadE/TadG family type IV pilus assembly protein [unclassified Yoonia]|uniref:TadE/TadG family type IV pilus assembly protein n=1 Tax=unclassified Yoonia TaxID=2629118 RepID=UPI002AFE3E11|nr:MULTISPECIES: TadE/TadG family type IV pilus assembly protein [unclassified Yoonia]
MTRFTRFLRQFCRDESGTSTIEFVIIAPVFFMFLFMGVELGMVMTRQAMLDRAVDISIRALRLGNIQDPTLAKLRRSICASTSIIQDCEQNLLLELRRVSTTTWDFPTAPPACIDRTEEIAPVTQITGGGSHDLMILRACLIIDPIFPTSQLGLRLPLDASGGYQMFATSAFVNEPR